MNAGRATRYVLDGAPHRSEAGRTTVRFPGGTHGTETRKETRPRRALHHSAHGRSCGLVAGRSQHAHRRLLDGVRRRRSGRGEHHGIDPDRPQDQESGGLNGTRVKRLFVLVVVLASLGLPGIASARQKTDLVFIGKADRVTGEIKQMSRGILILKTDNIGTVNIEWEDVDSLSSVYQF